MAFSNPTEISAEERIQEKIERFFLKRIRTTTPIGMLLALAIFFFPFESRAYAFEFHVLSLMAFFSLVLRQRRAALVRKEVCSLKNYRKWAWALATLNNLIWGGMLALAFFENRFSGPGFEMAIYIALSVSILAFYVLSGVRWLIHSFLYSVFLPPVSLGFYFYATQGRSSALLCALFFSGFFLFLLFLSKELRLEVRQWFKNEVDLEMSNEELKKNRETLIDQTAKLLHTSRLASLGEMAAGIAHEVNNPLSIVVGRVQQVHRMVWADPLDRTKMAERLVSIQDSADRITKIIRGLKQYSHQAEKDPLSPMPLNDILLEAVDFSSEKLKAYRIELHMKAAESMVISCRPVQISQILINLIHNALDVLKGYDGKRQISISIDSQGDMALLRVSNSGPLIDKNHQKKLFEPFFTTKKSGHGTGLGLSISRTLARDHGGDLVFEPAAPETTFILSLPRYKGVVLQETLL